MLPNFTTYARGAVALGLAIASGACSSSGGAPADTEGPCARATARLEELRARELSLDPTLARFPELAREHARQSRATYAAPVAARCADNPAVARCIAAAASFREATNCR